MADENILGVATRLGFEAVHCRTCNPIIDPQCGNCEGAGFVWRGRGATLSRSGLLRLAEWETDAAAREPSPPGSWLLTPDVSRDRASRCVGESVRLPETRAK